MFVEAKKSGRKIILNKTMLICLDKPIEEDREISLLKIIIKIKNQKFSLRPSRGTILRAARKI